MRRSAAIVVTMIVGWPASSDLQERTVARGADVLRSSCVGCHGLDLIGQQRLSREGWTRELDKMTGWGAVLPSADRDALLDYLTANVGSDAPSQGAATDPGASLVAARCVACHDRQLIEQQQLDADGWRREVDKMIGWGAAVGAQEKEPLVAYLARRYPSR